jgi:hypothetical protein
LAAKQTKSEALSPPVTQIGFELGKHRLAVLCPLALAAGSLSSVVEKMIAMAANKTYLPKGWLAVNCR